MRNFKLTEIELVIFSGIPEKGLFFLFCNLWNALFFISNQNFSSQSHLYFEDIQSSKLLISYLILWLSRANACRILEKYDIKYNIE